MSRAQRPRRIRRPVELLRDLDRPTGWVLLVDGVEQSYVDTEDATHLEFEYMQHMAIVIDVVHPRPQPLRSLHLGGGAMAMPRWVAVTRPGSRQVVVESDPDVLAAVAPLGAVETTTVVVADAAEQLEATRSGSTDLLIWDLYDGPRAVTSTLTIDGIASMRRALAPGGLLLLNVSDMVPFDIVRPVLAALRVAFDDVLLLAEPTTLRGRRSGNCVLAAARMPLPALRVARRAASAPVRGRTLAGEALTRFISDAVPPTETDPLPPPDEASGRAFL
ncbi:MAG TPA: fused MFS/spermidine synthase [Mycobacteriales bacterium]|nr:fused MFS/spermidine synthase [Mycobacteriales bacterium]